MAPEHVNFELHSLAQTVGCAVTPVIPLTSGAPPARRAWEYCASWATVLTQGTHHQWSQRRGQVTSSSEPQFPLLEK